MLDALVPVFLTTILATATTATTPTPPVPAGDPLVCHLDALSEAQRDRHRRLSGILARAVVETRELPDGYELSLDLARVPADAHSDPVCVVEVAEWADLEARCCPFLDFGIGLRGKGGTVKLVLTGGPGVKEFLRMEIPLLARP